MDASRSSVASQRGFSSTQRFPNPECALCLGNVRKLVFLELPAIFLHHLAAVLPGSRAPILDGSHGGDCRRVVFLLRGNCSHLRAPVGLVDWPWNLSDA